jgi:DNA-binding protein H-NS
MQPSLSELLAQQSALDRAIREARTADKAAAVARVRQLMSEHELTAADLVSKSPAKTGSTGKKVAPKYRDPVSGATWTGRGLKPKWLQTALEAGKSVTDFAI